MMDDAIRTKLIVEAEFKQRRLLGVRISVESQQRRLLEDRVAAVEAWRDRELAQRKLTWDGLAIRWTLEDEAKARDQAAEAKREAGANVAALLTLAVGVMLFATFLVYRWKLGLPPARRWDFLSYALPAMAALVAGLSAYIKKYELWWFWGSGFFVIAGLFAFLDSKGVNSTLLWNLIIAYGAAVALFLGPFARHIGSPNGKLRLVGKLVTWVGVPLLVGGVVFDIVESKGTPPPAFNDLVQHLGIPNTTPNEEVVCRVIATDASGKTLHCPRE